MAYNNKAHIAFVIITPPDQVEEGDRILKSHADWIRSSHDKSGDNALLSYNVSKSPELSNPLDPNSSPTGNTCFALSEIYESEAAVANHIKLSMETWKDFAAFGEWLQKCRVSGGAGAIVQSLW